MQKKYETNVAPALRRSFGHKNVMAIPRIVKVIVNTGVGRIRDEKQLEAIRKSLALITGQQPAPRAAKKDIAAF